MAKTPLNDDLALQLRRAVNDAYAFVRGREVASSFSAVTFEDLAAQQLERLSGQGTPTRPNYIERVKKVEEGVLAAVEQIRALPPEAFRKPDDERDVNTPVLQVLAFAFGCGT